MLVSIIIRTYNESKYLGKLLKAIQSQKTEKYEVEVVLVDSGSTDNTIEIAGDFGCRLVYIDKEEFTFGRSLNLACKAAYGEIFVFISGHCIPETDSWLVNLIKPLVDNHSVYSYGRQVGNEITKFSEHQVFNKYYPDHSSIPQDGFFCNNANAALRKFAWQEIPFCEDLMGLEDMYLAKKLVERGDHIAYVSDAVVCHIHDESWSQIKTRYEREAIALQVIMPELHISLVDFLKYFIVAVAHDLAIARRKRSVTKNIVEIFVFRHMHYWGTYRGNHEHKKLSKKNKNKYFYPK